MGNEWSVKTEYMPRPMASAEAWVYSASHNGTYWGTLVDEKIRYKTLFEPGSDIHPDLDEIIVPIEGRYWVKVNDWSRTLVPGEAAIIPRETNHDSGTATNLVGTHFLVLLFNKELGALKDIDAGGVKLPSGCLFWLQGAFRFLRYQGQPLKHFSPLITLPEFFRDLATDSTLRLPCDTSHPDPVVTELIRLLEQPDTPPLEELAKQVALSPAHLQKRFKGALGCSPLQYALAWRLDAIAECLMQTTQAALVDLAVEYGFGDMKHFREQFFRRFGMTPSAYRKNPPS